MAAVKPPAVQEDKRKRKTCPNLGTAWPKNVIVVPGVPKGGTPITQIASSVGSTPKRGKR